MSKQEINLFWLPEPKEEHPIVIQSRLEQVINRINLSIKHEPLTFPRGRNKEQWVILDISLIEDETRLGKNLLGIKIGKLLKSPLEEKTPFDNINTIGVSDLGNNLCSLYIPLHDIQNNYFYENLVKRLMDLWPETRRQCSDYYLLIPQNGTFESVYKTNIGLSPQQVIQLCYEACSVVDKNFVYQFGPEKHLVESTLYSIDFPPDFDVPSWEFFIISKDKIPTEDDKGYSRILVRGLTNITIKVEIIEGVDSLSNIYISKNIDLPLPAFYPGEGPQKLMREPNPYEKSLTEFINKLQVGFENAMPNKSKQERRREKDNRVFEQRLREFSRIKKEHPEYTREKVAMEYNYWLLEQREKNQFYELDTEANEDTVSNTFRKAKKDWEPGERTR